MPDTKISKVALAEAIAAYLPETLVQQLLQSNQSGLPDLIQPHHFDVVTMLVDITGFTPLCEALARKGREGAEQVSQLINAFFSLALAQVKSRGGVVAKFGGDAFSAFFPRSPAQSWDSVLSRAMHSAFSLQQLIVDYQGLRLDDGESQIFRLSAKVGLSAGSILTFGVGTLVTRRDFQIVGLPFNHAAEAESQATGGEIVIDHNFLEKASGLFPQLKLGEQRGNCFLVTAFESEESSFNDSSFSSSKLFEGLTALVLEGFLQQAKAFIPRPIYERLSLGYKALPGEHRRVVSLFLNFTGFDWISDPRAPAQFREYYLAVLEEVERYQGYLNRISSGDKGDLFHIIFGAPVTHHDDEEQSVRCALALHNLKVRFSFIPTQKIGLSSGFAFAGDIGSPNRHEYTVMGDTINLSARLMQLAPNLGILLDGTTARQIQNYFDITPPRLVQVKGKSQPIPVCEVKKIQLDRAQINRDPDIDSAAPVIYGRETEVRAALHHFQLALADAGQLLSVSGEPGIGKTFLLTNLAFEWRKRGGRVCRINLLNYERGAFNLWARALADLSELSELGASQPDVQIRRLVDRVGRFDAELVEWVPLWAELLKLPMPESAWLRSLDRATRRLCLTEITARLLKAVAKAQPLLLLCDDFHWVDSASLELLGQILPALEKTSCLIALGFRTDLTPNLNRLKGYPGLELALAPLSSAASREMVEARLGPTALEAGQRERFVSQVIEMAGGNPFFIDELVSGLRAGNGLEEAMRGAGATSFSPNVQSVIMNRLDTLDSYLREVLLVAAIIGDNFSEEVIRRLLPPELAGSQRHDSLGQLHRLDLLYPQQSEVLETNPSYRFRHALLQQVAYDSLPFARRRNLHEQVGEYFETQTSPAISEANLERLTFHYERSLNHTKAVLYLARSADRAARLFANQEALRQYQSALQKAALAGTETTPTLAQLWAGLGDVQAQIADFESALNSYGRALDLTKAGLERAGLEQKRAEVLVRATRFSEALQVIGRTEAELGGLASHRSFSKELKLAQAQLAELYSTILHRQSNYEAARQRAEAGLKLLEGNNLAATNKVRIRLHQAVAASAPMLHQSDLGQAALSKALRLARREEDVLTQGQLQLRLAILAMQREQLQKAANLFRQALPLIERTGTRDRLAHLLLPGSQTFWNRGEFILAEQWAKRGLELAQAVGTPYLLCSGQTLLGLIYTAMGDWNQACRYFEESTAMAQKHGLWDRYADTLSRHAFILFYRGEYRQAEQLTEMALECATQNKLPVTAKLCNRILAEGYYNRGQFDRAAEYLRQAGIEASRISNSVEANTFLRVAEWWALNGLNREVSSTRLLSVQEIEQKTQEARKLLEARGFKLFLPTAYRTTALLAWLQGRAEDATHYFKRGLTVARSTSNLPEIARLLLWFSCFRLSCESEVSMRTIRPDLKEAAALFAFLGAAPELQQAEQRLASLTSRR